MRTSTKGTARSNSALAAAAPRDRVTLYLVDNLSHVDLDPGGLPDSYRLLAATYRLLALRDRD